MVASRSAERLFVLIFIPLTKLKSRTFTCQSLGGDLQAASACALLESRSNSSISASSNLIRAAEVFSSRCLTLEVPGIGSITGDFPSSQGIAIGEGRTFSCSEIYCSGVPGFARLPVARGNQGINPIFSLVQ